MYLGLQGTKILVGFLRVTAASSAESVYARDWSNDIRAGEGLAWRRWQIELHTATGLDARSSNQQRGCSAYASCL